MLFRSKEEIFVKTIIIDKDVVVIRWFFRLRLCQAKTGSAPSDLKQTSHWAVNQEFHQQSTGRVMTSLWLLDRHRESTVEPRTPEEIKTVDFSTLQTK